MGPDWEGDWILEQYSYEGGWDVNMVGKRGKGWDDWTKGNDKGKGKGWDNWEGFGKGKGKDGKGKGQHWSAQQVFIPGEALVKAKDNSQR